MAKKIKDEWHDRQINNITSDIADILENKIRNAYWTGYEEAKMDMLRRAEALMKAKEELEKEEDMVKVVRCKDCIAHVDGKCDIDEYSERIWDDKEYCSYGERRIDGQ